MTTTPLPLEFPLLFPIGLFHPSRLGGGPSISVLWLCRALTRRGALVRVVTSADGVDSDGLAGGGTTDRYGVPTEYVAGSRWARYLPRVVAATRAPGRLLVHLSSCFAVESVAAATTCVALSRPFVLSPRGEMDDAALAIKSRKKRLAMPALRLLYRRAAAIHVTCEAEVEYVRRNLCDHPHIVLIPNGLDALAPSSEPTQADVAEAASHGPYLLYLGRISEKKSIEELVSTLPLLPAYLRLVIAGNLAEDPGYTRLLEARIDELGLRQRVDLVGHVAGARKTALFRAAELAVLPSRSENFGLVVVEALAEGTPVLATTGTPWRELSEDGCGYWTAGTPEEMARAINRHHKLKGPERRAMGERGRQLVDRRYRIDKLVDDYLEMYRRAAWEWGRST